MQNSSDEERQWSRLHSLAELLSSASDPELAAWQEAGLARPGAPARVVVWAIALVSLVAGLVVVLFGGRLVIGMAVGLAPALSSPRRSVRQIGLLVILAGLVTVVAGGIVAFTSFQALSRFGFAVAGRPRT